VHFVGCLLKITDYCVWNEQNKVFKTPKEVLAKQRKKSQINFDDRRNITIVHAHPMCGVTLRYLV
jgi:hypothetical protein